MTRTNNHSNIHKTMSSTCEGRLTLESGVAVSTTDQTAKTTVYFTPHIGTNISLYDSGDWDIFTFSELSLSISGYTADTNYDIFVYDNSGTLTLESTAWTDDTTRATALTTQDGVYVKSGATTRRYLGTIRTTSSTGQCEDSVTRRFVWSYYNQVKKLSHASDSGDHTYTTLTWRAWNNSTTARFFFVVGLTHGMLIAQMTHQRYQYNTFALDGTTFSEIPGNNLTGHNGLTTAGYTSSLVSHWMYVDAGYHFIQAMEYGLTTYGRSNNTEVEAYLSC